MNDIMVKALLIFLIMNIVAFSRIYKNINNNTVRDYNVALFFLSLDKNFQQKIHNKYHVKDQLVYNGRFFKAKEIDSILTEIAIFYAEDKLISSQASAFRRTKKVGNQRPKYYPLVIRGKKINK